MLPARFLVALFLLRPLEATERAQGLQQPRLSGFDDCVGHDKSPAASPCGLERPAATRPRPEAPRKRPRRALQRAPTAPPAGPSFEAAAHAAAPQDEGNANATPATLPA